MINNKELIKWVVLRNEKLWTDNFASQEEAEKHKQESMCEYSGIFEVRGLTIEEWAAYYKQGKLAGRCSMSWKIDFIGTSKCIVNKNGDLVLNVSNFSDRVINNILALHKQDCELARNKGYEDMREAYKEAKEDELKDTTHSNQKEMILC